MKLHAVLLLALLACGGPRTARTTTTAPPPAKLVQVNKPGEMVRVELEPGYVMVIDFWGEHCGACAIVGKKLEEGVADDPKILIRKIDVGDGFTPVAEAYEITTLPHFRIFDKQGQMRHVLVGNETIRATELAKQLSAEPWTPAPEREERDHPR